METKNQTLARLARSPLAVTRELIMRAGETAAGYAPSHYELERRYRDYGVGFGNVVAPRGWAKSTILAGGCALHHLFLEDLDRWLDLPADLRAATPLRPTRKHVVLISKTQKEAKKRLTTLKNVLGNDDTGTFSAPFRNLFGDYGQGTAAKWTEEQVVLKDGSVITAIGTGQTVRGLNEGGLRPTLVLIDDPEDEENTKTAERMQANIRWLFNAVRPALDRGRGRLWVIGTPLNTQSMVVRLHLAFAGSAAQLDAEREAGTADGVPVKGRADSVWFQIQPDVENVLGQRGENRTSVKTSLAVFVDESKGERLEEDNDGSRWIVRPGVLWPEWTPLSVLDSERSLAERTEGVGVGGFYREHCCLVVGDSEQTFGPSFFEASWRGRYEPGPAGREEQGTLTVTHLRGQPLETPLVMAACITTGVDPAFSTSDTADRTGIANCATTFSPERGEEVWELPGVYRRLHPSQLLGAIAQNHARWAPVRGLIEVTAAQVFVAQQLHEHHKIRYIHDRPRTKKVGVGSRVASLEPAMNPESAGKGRVPRFHHAETSPLKSELLNYPRGKDDFADATEKAYRARVRPSHNTEVQSSQSVKQRNADPLTL